MGPRRRARQRPPTRRQTQSVGKRSSTSAIAVLALLFVVGAWTYSTSFPGVFVWDDVEAIVTNPHLRSLSGSFTTPPDTTLAGRPVASLTFAVNYALAPLDAREVWEPGAPGPAAPGDPFLRNVWGYHAVNLAIHLVASVVMFGVVRRTVLTAGLKTGGSIADASTLAAATVAAIWLVHPLHTSAVTYIVQRVESLMGLWLLVTIYAAIRTTEPGGSRSWIAIAIVACALGMATKEVMVVAPLLVLLWIWLFRSDRPLAEPRVRALLVGLAATWILLIVLVAGTPRAGSAGFGVGGWTWWSYLTTQIEIVTHYLELILVPRPLVFAYAWPPAEWNMDLALRALVLVSLTGLTLVAVVRRHPVAFPGAWFFLILAPTSSILPIATEVAAEHRLYLPAAAVIVVVVIVACQAGLWLRARASPERQRRERRLTVTVGVIAATIIVAVFAGITHTRNRDYWSVESLLGDTVEKRPLDVRVRLVYGVELLESRRFAEAEHHLRLAMTLPNRSGTREGWEPMARMYLGAALSAQEKLSDGIAELERALALDANLTEAHAFLGEAYAAQGRIGDAVRALRRSLALTADQPNVMRRLAWFLSTTTDDRVRDGAAAVTLAERAVAALPGDPLAWSTLAAAYAEVGRFPDALTTARRALAIAQDTGRADLLAALASDIAVYESRRPLRQ
jgi:cytochrome c-type biogenesis protein CcmH/NrfG